MDNNSQKMMKKKPYEQPRIDVVNQAPWLMDDELFINLSNPESGEDDPRSKEFDFDGDGEDHDWDANSLWKKSKWEEQ